MRFNLPNNTATSGQQAAASYARTVVTRLGALSKTSAECENREMGPSRTTRKMLRRLSVICWSVRGRCARSRKPRTAGGPAATAPALQCRNDGPQQTGRHQLPHPSAACILSHCLTPVAKVSRLGRRRTWYWYLTTGARSGSAESKRRI